MARQLDNLAPHKSTFGLEEPFKVTRNLSMPKTVISTISNWMHLKDADDNKEQRLRMMDDIPCL